MKLIFIYGQPAVGKLTVAQELEKLSGYKLFHNHLVVDLLLSTFEFGSAPFVELREQIWLSVFDHACRSSLNGLIFTFNPERTVRPGFVGQVIETIGKNGGGVEFIELACPLPELKGRLDSPSRRQHRKLTSLALFEALHAAGEFDTAQMPKPKITIDTSLSTPTEAAIQIVAELNLPNSQTR